MKESSLPIAMHRIVGRIQAQQRREQAELRAEEKHQMKKDAHYWEVLKKDGEACHQIGLNLIQKLDAAHQNPSFPAQLDAELQKHNVKKGTLNLAAVA